jgi:hypothetical protein
MPILEVLEHLEWERANRESFKSGVDRKLGQHINDIRTIAYEVLRERADDVHAAGLADRADLWLNNEKYL